MKHFALELKTGLYFAWLEFLLCSSRAAFILSRLAGLGQVGSGALVSCWEGSPHCLLGSETQCIKKTKDRSSPCGASMKVSFATGASLPPRSLSSALALKLRVE